MGARIHGGTEPLGHQADTPGRRLPLTGAEERVGAGLLSNGRV
jgi:hypothetical protein